MCLTHPENQIFCFESLEGSAVLLGCLIMLNFYAARTTLKVHDDRNVFVNKILSNYFCLILIPCLFEKNNFYLSLLGLKISLDHTL